jgi:putative pyruvate formate lyase activating enzyme
MMKPVEAYKNCRLCPHACAFDRSSGKTGICGEAARLRLATAGLHFGEEPPLTGQGGSGTIFLSGCSMKCPFCQNHQISRSAVGRIVDQDEFFDICRSLKDAGAENLNLVTPSHMAPTLVDYLSDYLKAEIDLPVAWNSSGYETLETIQLVKNTVDIWLPDLKTLDEEVALRVYGARDYPEAAGPAMLAMAETGVPELNKKGRMTRGLMVRHLVLPGELESTKGVLMWFAEHLAGRAWLSLMTQYTPLWIPGEKRAIPGRQLTEEEYEKTLSWLDDFGIDDGFVQDLVPGDDWLPDFRRQNPFSSDLSRILWRWDSGFL